MISSYSIAQRNDFRDMPPEERVRIQTDRTADFLELDSLTKDKVFEINMKYAREFEAGRKEGVSRYEVMKQMDKLNASKNKEMKMVLTKDQYKKYLRQQQEMRNRMQQRMESDGGNRPQRQE
jgi:hypothetical protein